MFGIGGTELVITIIFGFLIFGPDRLPAMGRTIGRALRQFQQAQDQMNKMVKTEIYDPINEAAKAPEKKQGPKKKTTAAASSTKPETFAEKKARLAAEAQAKAQAKAAGEEPEPQADAIVVPERPVGRSETFAEKKARLEAEKAAAAAKKEKIAYQIEAEPGVTGTDAGQMQVQRGGRATGLVSLPLRYMHTPTEVISLSDVDACIKLLVRFVRDLDEDVSFVPGM